MGECLPNVCSFVTVNKLKTQWRMTLGKQQKQGCC